MAKQNPPKPTPDYENMFKLAEHYLEASRLLEGQAWGDQWGCSGPKILVDSFAVELYLKCLYVQDRNEAPPKKRDGHDLMELFKALNDGTRVSIRQAFDRSVSESQVLSNLAHFNPSAVKTTDFALTLEAARDTFKNRRYLYEEEKPGGN